MNINIYARQTKLNDVVGRSRYINSKEKQEEIVLSDSRMIYSWKEHATYENDNQKSSSGNIQAREIVLALPNNLYYDKDTLKNICDKFALAVADQNDYEYAVHWNHTRTNLHMHLIFSERKSLKNRQPKIYKKDIWQDPITHKLTKSGEGILVHKKGDLQLDESGNVKYSDQFTAKDPKFKAKSFTKEIKLIAQKIFNESGYCYFSVYGDKSPYLHQEKVFKALPEVNKRDIEQYNQLIKEYNAAVAETLKSDNYDPVTYDCLMGNKKRIFKQSYLIQENIKKMTKGLLDRIKKTIKEAVLSFLQNIDNIKKENDKLIIETDATDKQNIDIEINSSDYNIEATDEEDIVRINIINPDSLIKVTEHRTWSEEYVYPEQLKDDIEEYYPNFNLEDEYSSDHSMTL